MRCPLLIFPAGLMTARATPAVQPELDLALGGRQLDDPAETDGAPGQKGSFFFPGKNETVTP